MLHKFSKSILLLFPPFSDEMQSVPRILISIDKINSLMTGQAMYKLTLSKQYYNYVAIITTTTMVIIHIETLITV